MFKVLVHYPYAPGLGQPPSDEYVFDTPEEMNHAISQMRAAGITDIDDWEMSESEVFHHNVGVHCPNGY